MSIFDKEFREKPKKKKKKKPKKERKEYKARAENYLYGKNLKEISGEKK